MCLRLFKQDISQLLKEKCIEWKRILNENPKLQTGFFRNGNNENVNNRGAQ